MWFSTHIWTRSAEAQYGLGREEVREREGRYHELGRLDGEGLEGKGKHRSAFWTSRFGRSERDKGTCDSSNLSSPLKRTTAPIQQTKQAKGGHTRKLTLSAPFSRPLAFHPDLELTPNGVSACDLTYVFLPSSMARSIRSCFELSTGGGAISSSESLVSEVRFPLSESIASSEGRGRVWKDGEVVIDARGRSGRRKEEADDFPESFA
jgi:hypothetical protein